MIKEQTQSPQIRFTPDDVKSLFKPFLFPCNQEKEPVVGKGTWSVFKKDDKTGLYKKNTKRVVRGIDSPLCGVDCADADIIVVDFDTYKEVFRKSEGAKAFLEKCTNSNNFFYETPGGGFHFFFKQPDKNKIGCPEPYPGVEIKGMGGYVCLYNMPFKKSVFETFDELFDALPVFDFTFKDYSNKKTNQKDFTFGPGNNNQSIPHRAGKSGAHGDFKQAELDLIELLFNNRFNIEGLKTHIQDYFNVVKRSYEKFFIPKNSIDISNLDNDHKLLKKYLNNLLNTLLKHRNSNEVIKPLFYDDHDIYPKVGCLLKSGQTESGKTAHTLNDIVKFLKKGIVCNIWEHGELNREKRLNDWIDSNELKKYIESGQLFISIKRKEIIDRIQKNTITFIDDCDGFLKLKNPLCRREVGDAGETLELIAVLTKCLIICCHYQTKASQKEKSIQGRSGGGLVWIAKFRNAVIIEKAKTGNKIFENTAGERREEEEIKSFLSIQKGYRPDRPKREAWWLKDDYSIGEAIDPEELNRIISDKADNKESLLPDLHDIVDDYFDKNYGCKGMPTADFYRIVGEIIGLKKTQAYEYFKNSNKYTFKAPGFGKDKKSLIIKK